MIGRIAGVTQVQSTGTVSGANAYRSPLHPLDRHQRPDRPSRSLGLLAGGRHHRRPGPLPQRRHRPTSPSPSSAPPPPSASGIDRVYPGERIWVGGQWFYVAGILKPAVLASAIDSSVLVGYPAAEKYLGFDGHPSTIYLRAQTDQVNAVDDLLAATANPENPERGQRQPALRRPVAQADAKSALNGLFLGLGAVALLVGAVGVANIMIISVLERRSEIGLRRALGATRGHIRTQFLSEAILLALLGGAVGVALGALPPPSTPHQRLASVIPTEAWAGGFAAALIIGAVAGLSRPARRPPVTHPSPVDHVTRSPAAGHGGPGHHDRTRAVMPAPGHSGPVRHHPSTERGIT